MASSAGILRGSSCLTVRYPAVRQDFVHFGSPAILHGLKGCARHVVALRKVLQTSSIMHGL